MDSNGFKQIRRVILRRVLLVPVIILLLVCGTLVYYFANYSQQQVASELVRIASDHRRLIDQFFSERISDLQFISSNFNFNTLRYKSNLATIFYQLQSGSKAFFDLGVFDEQGNHVAYVGLYDLAGKNYAQTEWFKAVKEQGLYISDEFLGYRNIPHFIIAIKRVEGDRTWYIRATIDTFSFNDLVESIRVGKTGEAYIVNRQGILQTRRRSGGKVMETDEDYALYQIDDKEIHSFVTGGYWGQRYLYVIGPLKHLQWVLVVRQEIGDAYAPLTRAILVAIFMIIAGGAVVLVMTYIMATGLANQLMVSDMEKRQMRTQLIIAGKLAEVGEMSAGLAHEINNPLQVMKSERTLIEDILSDIEENEEIHDQENLRLIKDSVNQIGVQIERCGQITTGLLRFARKTESLMEQVKVQDFLPQVVGMIEQRARVENIRIVQKLDPDLPPILSDPNQLQQVFLNLLNNAVYALRGKDLGEIRIQAFQENNNITVTVTDNGCGISPEDMEKLFLPFFTTKPVGQGTGLGLSAVYGILKGLGGDITVSSELNVGTVFTVHLPPEPPGKEERIG
ncbi:MAG: GHKL domain-containing protein [Deltaproteobacteria bacterium]|nr:GHKL domain-containing protein [Deltaproteobacteria bacterium]MBW2051048.1 GHKL domain-containing protein [Deltaproteobacteria bacterium]MBW2140961.1 GHKL domain-containing protein [Deltaproteobacteria bacterium]